MDAHSVTSDHSLITFTLSDEFTFARLNIIRRYADTKIDATRLKNKIEENLNKSEREFECRHLSHVAGPQRMSWDDKATKLTEAITDACDQVLAKTKRSKVAFPPWWNADIHSSRQEVKRAHRVMLRTRSQVDRDTYKSKRNSHVALMRRVKKEFWINFVHQESTTSRNKWGKLTKWLARVTKEPNLPTVLEKSDNTYTTGIQDTIEYLMDELIPNSPDDPAPPTTARHNDPRGLNITYNDLKTIVWRQKNQAPGADGITIKETTRHITHGVPSQGYRESVLVKGGTYYDIEFDVAAWLWWLEQFSAAARAHVGGLSPSSWLDAGMLLVMIQTVAYQFSFDEVVHGLCRKRRVDGVNQAGESSWTRQVATTWFNRLKNKEDIKKKLTSAQRRTLLAITGAYRTVSTHASDNNRTWGFQLQTPRLQLSCGHLTEDARHIPEECTNANRHRERLRRSMELSGANWPYENSEYVKNRISWETLTNFAACYLKDKEKERLENR
ncbi:hypothetical protein ACI65C_004842 [Semiaphis heraclei]